jgi:hypothetical protein
MPDVFDPSLDESTSNTGALTASSSTEAPKQKEGIQSLDLLNCS